MTLYSCAKLCKNFDFSSTFMRKFDDLQNGLEEIENDVNKATVHKCGLEGKTHNVECWQEMSVQE